MGTMTPYAARITRERIRLQLGAGLLDATEAKDRIVALTRLLHEAPEPDPIARLARQLGVDKRAEDFLAFVTACCADPACAAALLRVQGASSQHGVTIASYVAVAAAREEGHDLALALGPDHPLVASCILESRSDASITPALRLWAVPPRVPRFFLGHEAVSEPLVPVAIPALALFDEPQRGQLDELAHVLASGRPLVVIVEGPSGSGRATAAAVAAQQLGRAAVALPLDRIDRSLDTFEQGLRGLAREAALVDAVPVIRGIEELDGPDELPRRRRLEQFLAATEGPIVVTSALDGQPLRVGRELVRVAWAPCPTAARRNLWEVLLAATAPDHVLTPLELDELGHRYTIGAGAMRDAITSAQLTSPPPLAMPAVVAALRHHTTERLTGLTTHVQVRQEWSDLVLAKDTRDQIDALIARVRHSHQVLERWGLQQRVGRATGIAALFSGPPGTGKTMVAGLVAKELGLDLHQIELSAVVSKYIGETEKQLAQIFDAAGSGHCLLLFDEADALFTKRTDVKSSTDRYSNLEVNFLLQRMEAFRGIVILTTNLDTSMDPAFKRRLAAHVVFWPPDEDERERLWRSFLGTGLPLAEDLDIDRLVQAFPDLSGAHIRNAVLSAAFAAATSGKAVTQAALESAARNEYATMGRVLARTARS